MRRVWRESVPSVQWGHVQELLASAGDPDPVATVHRHKVQGYLPVEVAARVGHDLIQQRDTARRALMGRTAAPPAPKPPAPAPANDAPARANIAPVVKPTAPATSTPPTRLDAYRTPQRSIALAKPPAPPARPRPAPDHAELQALLMALGCKAAEAKGRAKHAVDALGPDAPLNDLVAKAME